MVPPQPLLASARRAILGSAEAALWGLKSIKGSCHNFCTAIFKDVTYKELKNLLNSKKIMLIDVRETWEIVEYGKIPGSINIPLLNTMLEDGRNGQPMNFQRRNMEIEFWNTSWLFPDVYAAYNSEMNKRITV